MMGSEVQVGWRRCLRKLPTPLSTLTLVLRKYSTSKLFFSKIIISFKLAICSVSVLASAKTTFVPCPVDVGLHLEDLDIYSRALGGRISAIDVQGQLTVTVFPPISSLSERCIFFFMDDLLHFTFPP